MRIFAIPNGEKRAISVAKRLKAEGVKSGVPDLYVPALRLWIEMKRQRGGRLPPEQLDWHDYLMQCGDTVIVGHGAQDASKKVLEFLAGRGNVAL